MPRRLTFRERQGFSPLPPQLRTDELSQELRARLWALYYSWFEDEDNVQYGPAGRYLDSDALRFAKHWHVAGEHKPLDEFSSSLNAFTVGLKQRFFARDFYPLFDLIEFSLSSQWFPVERKELIPEELERCRAGWRVIDRQLVPVASDDEAAAIAEGLSSLEGASEGVRAHIRKASEFLSKGRWADSARESISAVEAAARAFDEKKTLGEIVKGLKSAGKPIHPALAKALSSLYGYASDEKGIRHSLVDEADAAVGEGEALLLFGIGVFFAQYLVRQKAAS